MTSPRPVPPNARIAALDALRGIALCGILLINIFDMGGPIAMDRPMAAPAFDDPNWQIWTVAQLFVTGTMRGLFSMLFGIGLILFIGDDESAERSKLYFRRLLWLLLFGIIDATVLLWPGDILIIYAMAGILALILHPLKPRQQIAAGATILVLISAWSAIEAAAITPADTVYSADMLAREGAARLGGYWQTFDYMSYVSWSWTMNALSYRATGDALAFMLIGMGLYRMGLFDPATRAALIRRIMLTGYAVGLSLRLLNLILVWHNGGAPTFISASIDQPGRLAMTLGHAGLFLMLWRRSAWPGLMAWLGAMGRMALTLYLAQSLLAAGIFSGFGLGLWNQLSWPQLWLVAAAILIIQAAFAVLWFRAFRHGPVEWLWRWGTYGRRPD